MFGDLTVEPFPCPTCKRTLGPMGYCDGTGAVVCMLCCKCPECEKRNDDADNSVERTLTITMTFRVCLDSDKRIPAIETAAQIVKELEEGENAIGEVTQWQLVSAEDYDYDF